MRAKIIVLIFLFVLSFNSFSFAVSKQKESWWVEDRRSGCTVEVWDSNWRGGFLERTFGSYNEDKIKKSDIHVTWSGKCLDGKAHGTGTLEWYYMERKFWFDNITETNGVVMVNGKLSPKMDFTSIDFRIDKCETTIIKTVYRSLSVDVPKEIELGYSVVEREIVKEAMRYANKKCPLSGKHGPSISAYFHYKDSPHRGSVGAYSNAKVSLDCREIINNPKEINKEIELLHNIVEMEVDKLLSCHGNNFSRYNLMDRIKDKIDEEYRTALKKQEQVEEEERRKMIEERKSSSRKIFDVFEKNNEITDWPTFGSLEANPFVYKGKNIGLEIQFVTMITETQGIFGNKLNYFLVSDIPKGFFSKESNTVLAGRVIGKEYVKLPLLGDTLISHLKFINAHICKDSSCDELLFWKKK